MTSAQIDTTAALEALEADNNRLKGQIKMKEELIPGMEKMIAYLHKIQEENKELKKENKTIKFLYDKEKNWREVAEKMVDSVRMELCCRDKAGEDVSWDDIADCVDYHSHQEEYEKQYEEEYGELTDK